ncbi:MAG: SPOR domain-containing protein [Candidatus Omnitrophica bacterium]|nr:SPOR domain-containing protein [Candidatus Omnitrophota bacterium]
MVQGELFREDNSSYINNFEPKSKGSFLGRHQVTLTLDKGLLVLLGLTVVFVLTYSFGVERGKRAVEEQWTSFFPAHTESFRPTDQGAPPQSLVGSLEETVLKINPEDTAGTAAESGSKPEPQNDHLVPAPVEVPVSLSVASGVAKEGTYTVQLVTYKDEQLATREVDRLKAKGHRGFVIPSGPFYQVCADYFENLSKARGPLKKFQASGRYPDAFVRPVIRTSGTPS